MNTKIFRAYDIRGVYPKDINKDIAYEIGRSFADFLFSKGSKKRIEELSIVVGRDGRKSSPEVAKGFIEGIVSTGANVTDIGLATTPMLYFASAHYYFDGGVEVSASHNPPEYNGFKLVTEGAKPISEKTGLVEIKGMVLKGTEFNGRGVISNKEILKDYVDFILKDFKVKKPFKVVIDTANGITGIAIPEIFNNLPFKIHHIFSKLDGSFPNHPPDPLIEANLESIKKEIKSKKADIGIAFDGDGDRIIFLDEKSNPVQADMVCSLVAGQILKENPKAKIMYDLRSSNIVKETIEKLGGIPVMGRVGHSFIKERMRKEDIAFAEELSGHYYSKDRYFCESPFFVFFKVLEKMEESGKPLSELTKEYKKYFHSGEINFKVKDKEKAIKELEETFKEGKVSNIDGIRVDFDDWWFNVRPSNTEPLLRLVVEAENKKSLEKRIKEISDIIEKF